jgi:uncharacterized repeat protein (TIGR02543 family)
MKFFERMVLKMRNKLILVVLLVFSFVSCDNGNGTTTYTVTFNSNGGSNVASITGISSESTITLPRNPTKEGNFFGGWYIDNETFHDFFESSTETITGDITLYAMWYSYIPSSWTPAHGGSISSVKQLSDSRFNGVFTGTMTLQSIGVFYENRLIFDGTNRMHYFHSTSRNEVLDGQPYQAFYEIEIDSNGKYRRRLWNNQYDDWTEWFDYEFVSGNRLMIQWYDFYTIGDGVFNKYGELTVLNQNSIRRSILDISDLDISEKEIYLIMKDHEERQRKEYNDLLSRGNNGKTVDILLKE